MNDFARLPLLSWPSPRWLVVGMVGLLLISAGTGCRTATELGRLGPPGTMESQRVKAMLHDPYPSREIGPEIFSSRPLDFEQPRDEVYQLQTATPRRTPTVVQPPRF